MPTHNHDAAHFDRFYSESDQLWSGAPNAALVAEIEDVPPARALDVGCGEGADALWLAQRGWTVTAIDPSNVAVERTRRGADAAGARIDVRCVALEDADLPAGEFDFVSACYAALRRTPEARAERLLAALVAPGGLLFVVHHADVDVAKAREHGCDPDAYITPEHIRDALGEGWTVERFERRDRNLTAGAGAHHHVDVVLLARRAH